MNQASRFSRQKGVITLSLSMILLFVITMVTLYTAKTAVREQQISANQYRSEQAISEANAKLDFAFDYHKKNGYIATLDMPRLYGDEAPTNESPFTDPAVAPNANDPITILVTGYSDDLSAKHTISVQVDSKSLLRGGGPDYPLVTHGATGAGGNLSVINRFSNRTIWAGNDISLSGTAETFVAEPGAGYTRAQLIDITGSPDPNLVLNASNSSSGLNSDVIDLDDNLKNMSNDEFFDSFFQENRETIEMFANDAGQRYSAGSVSWNSDLSTDATEPAKGIIWVEGDFSPSGSLTTIGTEANPVTLIVNGDFTAGGGGSPGIRIIGILYVAGDMSGGSNFAVQGSVMIEGALAGTGTPTIVFDADMLGGDFGNGPGDVAVIMPGTWKDWVD